MIGGGVIRLFRALLIRNGLSEDEADAAINTMSKELLETPILDAQQYERLCERLAEDIANRVGKSPTGLAAKLSPWIIGICSGVIANRMTEAIQADRPQDEVKFPPLDWPVQDITRLERSEGVGILVAVKHAHLIMIRSAVSGFVVSVETRPHSNDHLIAVRFSPVIELRHFLIGRARVRKGEFIQRGAIIGEMTEPRCILGMTVRGGEVNPAIYLPVPSVPIRPYQADPARPDDARAILAYLVLVGAPKNPG
jgi:hypothetical protein